ncbi:hypothetical protein Tco_0312059 [Tanacetum coccineum]
MGCVVRAQDNDQGKWGLLSDLVRAHILARCETMHPDSQYCSIEQRMEFLGDVGVVMYSDFIWRWRISGMEHHVLRAGVGTHKKSSDLSKRHLRTASQSLAETIISSHVVSVLYLEHVVDDAGLLFAMLSNTDDTFGVNIDSVKQRSAGTVQLHIHCMRSGFRDARSGR